MGPIVDSRETLAVEVVRPRVGPANGVWEGVLQPPKANHEADDGPRALLLFLGILTHLVPRHDHH